MSIADNEAPEGTPSSVDALLDVIDTLLPERSRPWRKHRMTSLSADAEIAEQTLISAVAALRDPAADEHVGADVVAALLEQIASLERKGASADGLRAGVIAHVERRWATFVEPLAERAVQHYPRYRLFDSFPRLRDDPILFRRLAAEIAQSQSHSPWLKELLADLAPTRLTEARLLIYALGECGGRDGKETRELATSIFCALGRGIGWTPWVSLQALIHARPDYADVLKSLEPSGDKFRESQETIDSRLALVQAIEPQTKVRAVAGALLELVGSGTRWSTDGLLARPAETRAAYVETLRETIGSEPKLRQAVIEVLLWCADGQAADLAQFAATALAQAEDHEALSELSNHPVRNVQYGARALRAAKFGERLEGVALPTTGGLLQSLTALEGSTTYADEAARTWLGDRAVERLIEQTVASVEARVAKNYEDHGDEGEDRLLSSLFTELSLRFGDLNQALDAVARAASAPHRAAITLSYRNVDRAEEGAEGINGTKSFSADLCLIVDPTLDGRSLGRRVTLVQAKRLYRNHKAATQPAWDNSFQIKPEQLRDLMKQTHSSVYFFHGPPLGGRGVPVIPSQLVADLAGYQGSGRQLPTAMVAVASRSLADWFTYDALALRIGDHFQALVKKAKGRPGSLPRRLLMLPTVEVEVALERRSELR